MIESSSSFDIINAQLYRHLPLVRFINTVKTSNYARDLHRVVELRVATVQVFSEEDYHRTCEEDAAKGIDHSCDETIDSFLGF